MKSLILSLPDKESDIEPTWWRVWYWTYLMKSLILSLPDEESDIEPTWWRVWYWAYLMKCLILSLLDEESDIEPTWWRVWYWAYLMKSLILSLPDEESDNEPTWWRLFQKQAARTKFDIFNFIRHIDSNTGSTLPAMITNVPGNTKHSGILVSYSVMTFEPHLWCND